MKLPAQVAAFVILSACSITAIAQTTEFHLDEFSRQQLSDVYFSEGASAGDINGDGIADVVYGPYWFEGPAFETKHEIYPAVPQNVNGYADNFFSWVYDFDGDGANDVLTVGFPGTPGHVYRNPGKDELDGLWEKFVILDSVSNESPQFTDVTGDGIPELVCTRKGHYGFAQPKAGKPFEEWTFTSVSDAIAPTPFGHGLGVGDVNNDGRMDLLARDGWLEQPADYEPGDNWPFHKVAFAPASADMFAYDVDGDGDNDVITSLNAHEFGLAWYENTGTKDGEIQFTQHLIMGDKPEDNEFGVVFSELHAVQLADINGDGLKDIVTGKTYWSHHAQSPMWDAGAVVYWFELRRGERADDPVKWIPHQADDDSGIGRGLFVGDINNDDLIDVVAGGMKGTHVLTHSRREVTKAEWEAAQPMPRKELADGLSPEAAAAHMTVPPGFHVQLAAGEPMVHQPIAMCFDNKGRLWVAEAHTYPLRAPEGQGKDKILIFEDTNQDGVFDRSKTFIEGLNLVSGLEVGFGGVYVGAAPYLMFIPDADGDDVPDAPTAEWHVQNVQFPKDVPAGATVLLDGFGWHDTHETLNAFIWGPDGWLYGCHGVFTHSRVGKPGTPDDQRTPLNAGVWRYHPQRHEFEVFAHGTSNPWGVDFNEQGQAFISACVIPHLWHMVQGGRYHRQGGQHFNRFTYDDIKTIADHAHYTGNIRDHAWWGHEPGINASVDEAGGGHAHAGAMIYLGDNWPDEYRGRMYFNNIHGNRINCDILEPEGSGFVGHHGRDFMKANDRWYRGINLRYGPDGSVYVIDWYDPNACHRTNPEIWDRSNGRIYRVSYTETDDSRDAKLHAAFLVDPSASELLDAHDARNEWYVRMARKLLMDRASDSQIVDTVWSRAADNSRTAENRLRYLWTLSALDGLTDQRAAQLLRDGKEYIRAWTVQLQLEDQSISSELLTDLETMSASDSSPVVRLYLASALQRLPVDQRWTIAANLARHAEDIDDHNIPLVLWYGTEPLVPAEPARAMQLAQNSKIPLVTRYIIRRASESDDTIAPVVELLGKAPTPDMQQLVMDEMLASFEGRVGIPMPHAWNTAYDKLAKSDQQSIRDKADQLAILFGDQRVFPRMRNLLADSSQDVERRQQALNVLVRGQDTSSAKILLSDAVLNNGTLRSSAVKALSTLGNERVSETLLNRYAEFDEETRKDVISTLVSRPAWTTDLLNAIGSGHVPSADLHAYHVRQILTFNSPDINGLLKQHWGEVRESSADRQQLIADWTARLTPDVLKKAHPGNGRRIFNKTCQNCHKLFGEGGDIGPDITGSNRANLEYILHNVLDPSAVIGRDYRMTVLVLEDGRVVSGLLKQETDSAVTIQTINDKIVVPVKQIEERVLSDVSMMPERQLDELAFEEARDLIAYLGSPGQVAMSGPSSPIEKATGKVPGAIEGEAMKIVEKTAGDARSQDMGGFTKDNWSGSDQLWWTGAKPGDRLSLEVPVAGDATYDLEIVLTKARDYGIVSLLLDDKVLDAGIDCFNNPDVITTGVLTYRNLPIAAGDHRLTLEISGANPEAVKAYMVAVDYVRLVPAATSAE